MDSVIGVVGMGFVGKGCIEGFKSTHQVETYDINPALNPSCQTLEELVMKTDVIFVCVPTPSDKDGSCNTTILNKVVAQIDQECYQQSYTDKVIIVKSTVPPGTTMGLALQYHNVSICFNPEFLTEANWLQDFLGQDHIVLGYPYVEIVGRDNFDNFAKVDRIYLKRFPNAKLIFLSPDEAEFVKYVRNCMLALKVSFSNELCKLGKAMGIDWDNIYEAVTADPRVGKSHIKVPGPDGHYGFGGTCFPKDIQALISYAKEVNAPVPIAEAAWKRNIELDRPEKDWEQLKGRSVTE